MSALPMHLVLELDQEVFAAVAGDLDAVRSSIAEAAAALIRELVGAGAAPPVRVDVVVADGSPGPIAPVRLRAGGRDCDVAEQELWDALAYALGRHDTQWDVADLVAAEPGVRIEALAQFTRVALGAYACVLAPDDPDRAAVLDLGVALPLTSVPSEPPAATRRRTASTEDLLDEYAGSPIDIVVAPSYLPLLTEDPDAELFSYLREGLEAELGVPLPQFRLRTDATLRSRGFYFVINGVATSPRIGQPSGTFLVNDIAERLPSRDWEIRATSNPANARPAAFVSGADRASLVSDGYTVWNPGEYLILCLGAALRPAAAALLTRRAVEGMLDALAPYAPELVRAVRDRVPTADIATTARSLVRDGVSVRNFRRIVELLLRHACLGEDGSAAARLTAARRGLGDTIAADLSHGSGTVVVYLLAPDLARGLAHETAVDPPSTDTSRTTLAAVAEQFALLPATAWRPAVLTDESVRPVLADLLRRPFPRLRVTSYSDLPASVNVQPIARISFAG